MKQEKQNNLDGYRKSFRAGRTWFLVIIASILFYFVMLRLPKINNFLKDIFTASKPIIYGIIIAYILNPLVSRVERRLYPLLKKKLSKEKASAISRSIAIVSALALLLLITITLINMVAPNIYNSVLQLADTMPKQISTIKKDFSSFQEGFPDKSEKIEELLLTLMEKTNDWMDKNIIGRLDILMGKITQEIFTTVSEIFRIIVGLIVSVYVLYGKDKILNGVKRILYASFNSPKANEILVVLRKSHSIFGGFVVGKIIDSLIIGCLCYVGLLIFKMPYPVLVASLVGVTNIIPFFGPYMGAIPSFFLIAIDTPSKGIPFLLFILVLQQLDGNIIGPKILGDSTGLSAFWVIFSIMIGGGLYGVPGMILAVPTFGVLLYLINTKLTKALKNRHLPTSDDAFRRGCYVDDLGNYVDNLTPEDSSSEK